MVLSKLILEREMELLEMENMENKLIDNIRGMISFVARKLDTAMEKTKTFISPLFNLVYRKILYLRCVF
jgi:hypothetical protein